jgi:hypothetical protein
MRSRLRPYLVDLSSLAGAGLIVYGVWRVYVPAALVLAGVFLIAGSFAYARGVGA